jgi:hypothetical protein
MTIREKSPRRIYQASPAIDAAEIGLRLSPKRGQTHVPVRRPRNRSQLRSDQITLEYERAVILRACIRRNSHNLGKN